MNDYEEKMKAFKLKDKIISQISDNILDNYAGYDFFDITLTQEFMVVESLIYSLVDKVSTGQLSKEAYKKYCEHCNGNQQ